MASALRLAKRSPKAKENREQVDGEQPQRRKSPENEREQPHGDRDQDRGNGRRHREPAHPVLHDEAAVRERGAADGKHQPPEIDREQRAGRVGLLEDLLGGAQIGDERREHGAAGERESERRTDPEDFHDASSRWRGERKIAAARREGSPAGAPRTTAKAIAAMAKNIVKIARQLATHKIAWPRAGAIVGMKMKTASTNDIRRAMLASLVLVAHQGQRHHARSRRARALEDTARDHGLRTWERRCSSGTRS